MFHRALGIILSLVVWPALLQASDITGQVRIGTKRGLSIPATVQLVREREVVSEQFTDLDGRFEFLSVAPTNYTVRAKYEEMPEAEVSVVATNRNGRYRVPITIQPVKTAAVGQTETIDVEHLQISRAARHQYEDGLKYRKQNNCGRAIPYLRKAIDMYSRYAEAYNELGTCLQRQGSLAEAEKSFHKAIEYNTTIYPSINLANLYVTERRFESALAIIRTAIEKNPTEGDLQYALAKIYLESGNLKAAETTALEAHFRTHRMADVHLLLAKIYLSNQNYPAMLTQLETYLEENPNGSNAEEVRRTVKALRSRS